MNYIFPLIVGFTIVISMVQNGKLAHHIGIKNSTFINFITGTIGSLILLVFSKEYLTAFKELKNVPLPAYLGGIIGIAVVVLSTIVVQKISVIASTMLLYVGQLSMGIIIDLIRDTPLSTGKILGCLLIVIGVYMNSIIDKKQASAFNEPLV